MSRLIKKIFISANMTLITGLRIGDSKESVEIGGVDSPVVRRKDNHQPYIPGSSIKGKMRSLLELLKNENSDGKFHNTDSDICKLFGASENKENKKEEILSCKSKLLVRDAYLTENSAEWLLESDSTDMPYTEVKWENVINRTKGTAEHPRQLERIPAGADFTLNFVINVFEDDENEGESYVNLLKLGFALLNSDYLGGSGSRGYGQIEIAISSREDISTEQAYLQKFLKTT